MEYDTQPVDPFGVELSRNISTDTLVEIEGVTTFYPVVEIDDVNRTLTFTFDYVEGSGILTWIRDTVLGTAPKRVLSVIQQDSSGIETSRINYFGVFPVKYVHFTGYGMASKIKARVTVNFDFFE